MKKALKKRDQEMLTKKDQKILDEAVDFINRKLNEVSRSMIDIGEYLLDKFFDGDPKKVKSRSPRKGVSLRKLAERDDLDMSFSSLSNAVNLAVQEELLKEKESEYLTESHRVLLLSVGDEDEKMKYADQVIEEQMSRRELRALLIDDGFIKPRGKAAIAGKSEDAETDSSLDLLFDPLKTIRKIMSGDVTFDDIDPKKAKKTLDTAKKARADLDRLIKNLSSLVNQKE